MAGERILSKHHTLSVLVENQPGVLSRVSGLFSRRGFNIESLAVGPTEREDRSRITIRVDCTQTSIDQVIKQLYKLINVLKVNELDSRGRDRARAAARQGDGGAGPARRARLAGRRLRRPRRRRRDLPR